MADKRTWQERLRSWYLKRRSNVYLFYLRQKWRAKRVRDCHELAGQIGWLRYIEIFNDFQEQYERLRGVYGERAKKGRLEAFFETGTEGMMWTVYEDGKTGYAGLVSVDRGDRLIIFRHDGSVAFDGEVDPDFKVGYQPYPMNPKYGQPCAFGCWIHWTQRGWDVEEWARLFMWDMLSDSPDRVPLRAIIVKRPGWDQPYTCTWPEDDDEDEDEDNDDSDGGEA